MKIMQLSETEETANTDCPNKHSYLKMGVLVIGVYLTMTGQFKYLTY